MDSLAILPAGVRAIVEEMAADIAADLHIDYTDGRTVAGRCLTVSERLARALTDEGFDAAPVPAWDEIPAPIARLLDGSDTRVVDGVEVNSSHYQTLVAAVDDADGLPYYWRIDLTAAQHRNTLGWSGPWARREDRVW
jgi:hypothetical protein